MFLDTNILLRLNALSIMRSDPSCLLRLPMILSETSSDSDCYAHCISFRNTKIFVSLRSLFPCVRNYYNYHDFRPILWKTACGYSYTRVS